MSALTDRLYAAWKRQNGSVRGMGAVAPMKALQRPLQLSDFAGDAVMHQCASPRPGKQKGTPASVSSTPGALTNIGESNVDRTNCRP